MELHTINFHGKKKPPNNAKLEISLGQVAGTVSVKVQLPKQKGKTEFNNLPILNGVVSIPISQAFLCHAEEDKEIVKDVAERLLDAGNMIWFDEINLLGGADWENEILSAIDSVDYVLVFLSERSIRKTGYVQQEMKYALEQQNLRPTNQRFIIPILVDNVAPPREFSRFHWLKMSDENWWSKLTRSLAITK